LPYVYSSLRAVLAWGLIPKVGQKEERRRIKVLRVAFCYLYSFRGNMNVAVIIAIGFAKQTQRLKIRKDADF